MNVLPPKSGLSMEYYLREIVTQQSVDYDKDFRAEFESYAEAIIDYMETNVQTPQSHGCSSLGASGYRQG